MSSGRSVVHLDDICRYTSSCVLYIQEDDIYDNSSRFWLSNMDFFTVQGKNRKWAARRDIIKPTPFFYFSFINKLCTEKGVRYRKTPFPLHVFTFYAHFKGVVLRIICTKKWTPSKSFNDDIRFKSMCQDVNGIIASFFLK